MVYSLTAPRALQGGPRRATEPWASSLGAPRVLLGTPPLRAGVPMGPGSCGAYFLTPLEDPQGLRVGGIPTLKDSPFYDPPPSIIPYQYSSINDDPPPNDSYR